MPPLPTVMPGRRLVASLQIGVAKAQNLFAGDDGFGGGVLAPLIDAAALRHRRPGLAGGRGGCRSRGRVRLGQTGKRKEQGRCLADFGMTVLIGGNGERRGLWRNGRLATVSRK